MALIRSAESREDAARVRHEAVALIAERGAAMAADASRDISERSLNEAARLAGPMIFKALEAVGAIKLDKQMLEALESVLPLPENLSATA